MRDARLTVGIIVGTHGVRGELKLRLTTDDPDHLPQLRHVFLGTEERPRRLLGVRFHGEQALIRLDGIDSPEAGRRLRGVPVRIAGEDARPPAAGELFLYQLIGLTAYDEAGEVLGTVSDLIETGAHDVLLISPAEGADLLIPNHPDFVPVIEPDRGRLVARPLDFDEERREPPAAVPDDESMC